MKKITLRRFLAHRGWKWTSTGPGLNEGYWSFKDSKETTCGGSLWREHVQTWRKQCGLSALED
jgi:hypothetical protein